MSETFAKYHAEVFDRLTWITETGQVNLALTKSWDVPEPNTWRFELQEGVKFHDGVALTAEDVAWSMRRAREDTLPPYSLRYRNIIDANAVGPLTVEFTTESPDSFTLSRLSAFFVYPSAHFQAVGLDEFIKDPVGSGPFRWADFTLGASLELERAPGEHALRKTFLDNIKVTLIQEPSTVVAALRTGSLDGGEINAPPELVDQLRETDVEVIAVPGRLLAGLWNPVKECEEGTPLCDPRVRRALIISVDRVALADNIWRGLSEPVSQPGIPGSPGYDDSLPIVYDPEEAKQLLDDAGFPAGADGTRFAVDFLYWFKGPGEATLFAVQDMWREIGVDMDLEFMEIGQWLRYYRRQEGLDQRQVMGILLQDYFANNAAYLDRQSPTKTGANVWYQNDRFYELREQVGVEFDPGLRAAAMEQALREASEWEDAAFWYSLTVPSMWAVQDYVKGFRPESGTQFTLSETYRTK